MARVYTYMDAYKNVFHIPLNLFDFISCRLIHTRLKYIVRMIFVYYTYICSIFVRYFHRSLTRTDLLADRN